MRASAFTAVSLLALSLPARAIEVRVSAPALERTLRAQLFTVPPPNAPPNAKPERYYLKGSPTSPCNTYADDPHIQRHA